MAYTRLTWEDGQTALSAENMNNIEEGIGEALLQSQGNSDMWSYIRDLVYPIGSIYMSATLDTAAKVQAVFGGTWVAWGKGKVPVGVNTSDSDFNTAEKSGGKKAATLPQHNHTFTGTQMPTHKHTYSKASSSTGSTTLTLSQIPSHNHHPYHWSSSGTMNGTRFVEIVRTGSGNECTVQSTSSGNKKVPCIDVSGAEQINFADTTASAGGGGSHSHTISTTTTDTSSVTAGTPSGTIGNRGEADTTNANLQPYITCYMWKRTA